MKRISKKGLGVLISIIMVLLLSVPAYAQDGIKEMEQRAQEITIANQYVDETIGRISGTPRGMLISSVDLQLTKKGVGVANLYGEILCHEPMSRVRIVLILQKYDEANKSWGSVNRQEFEWKASDLPAGEELTMATISYNIAGLESGSIYRIRGLFGAYDLNGEYNEAWNANTPGVTF